MIKHPLPTGYLFVDDYERGQLETLSIGDYGKSANVKADFLGYNDNPLTEGVTAEWCKPLTEKWVITLSTQHGCVMKCNFCDVPNIPFQGNVPFNDLKRQLYSAIRMFPGVSYTERLNVHFARMGEPIFNHDVFDFARWMYQHKKQIHTDTGLRIETLHPVLTTSLPRGYKVLKDRILEWCEIKNGVYNGQAGLQFSINSTDEDQRTHMFQGKSLTLSELAVIAEQMPDPVSRKYCLNFAYSTDFVINADHLKSLFDPAKFMVKITPIHNNNACRENQIVTVGGYDSYAPYHDVEEALKAAGFDVLVFVPSMEEEKGLVTCGNVILGGGKLCTDSKIIKIHGLN